jgi:hypothetical protein
MILYCTYLGTSMKTTFRLFFYTYLTSIFLGLHIRSYSTKHDDRNKGDGAGVVHVSTADVPK